MRSQQRCRRVGCHHHYHVQIIQRHRVDAATPSSIQRHVLKNGRNLFVGDEALLTGVFACERCKPTASHVCGYLQLKVDGNAVAAGVRRASAGAHWHEIRLEKRERLARGQRCSALLHSAVETTLPSKTP